MSTATIPLEVQAAFPFHLRGEVKFLSGAGGFSGARFWRIANDFGQFCLRRWPQGHPNSQRLALQHSVLRLAQSNAIDFVPVPVPTVHGETWVSAGGHFWELTPWMPGKADFNPEKKPKKLIAAMKALANFHVAVLEHPGGKTRDIAPSSLERCRLHEQLSREIPAIHAALETQKFSDEFRAIAHEIVSGFAKSSGVADDLRRAAMVPSQLGPAIRDIHDEHVLFQDDTVTGMVDFGALRIDSVAVDISRLLGSMAGDIEASWQTGLAAYQSVSLITDQTLRLVTIFDRSTVVLSGVNWLKWILLEKRQFDDFDRVLARLRVTVDRLRHLNQQAT